MNDTFEGVDPKASIENPDIVIQEPRQIPLTSFDPDWYLSFYGDVRESGIAADDHYLSHGIYEGRFPTAASWRLAHFMADGQGVREVLRKVCEIFSTSNVDDATTHRYYSLLVDNFRSGIDIAQELVNERDVMQRTIAMERGLYTERYANKRRIFPIDDPRSPELQRQSFEKASDWRGSQISRQDLNLGNILDSGKPIDADKNGMEDRYEERSMNAGESLVEAARYKRAAILKSI